MAETTVPAPISRAEKAWLASRYPRLVVTERVDRLILRGLLDFHLTYNQRPIEDTYNVRFDIPLTEGRPRLQVTDGRLMKVLADHPELKGLPDLHMYTSGLLCTVTPPEWDLVFDGNVDIKRFFQRNIEPYFYSQSYFEQEGSWPWKHYAHSGQGIYQWFLEHWSAIPGAAAAVAKEIGSLAPRDAKAGLLVHRAAEESGFGFWHKCLCGSGGTYIDCHPMLAKLSYELRSTV